MIEYLKSKKKLEKENRALRITIELLKNDNWIKSKRIERAFDYILNDMSHLKSNSKEARNKLLSILIGDGLL